MRYTLAYKGSSQVAAGPYRTAVKLAPNLARERVWFDGQLRDPVRFREAISALHDVVVGDERFHRKDKAVYEAFLERKKLEEAELRSAIVARETEKALAEGRITAQANDTAVARVLAAKGLCSRG